MTRVNLIDPDLLTDQHLFAEYREITRIFVLVQRACQKHRLADILKKVPDSYRLGTGHVCFFYDKLAFVERRYFLLKAELQRRQYQFTPKDDIVNFRQQIDGRLYQDFQPQAADVALSVSRLFDKIADKPNWYRWHGDVIDDEQYCQQLRRLMG
ncbi:pyrimidine dimer DNA glycosylase/endonuclease V [Moraxella marmotae]|uniref:pyrimidine dimer DNA glycosylase/endonuclease V n=1 Tax=Moraxella marmotae TaxID=3344520 RepID=UPI0035F4F7C5